MTHLALTVLNMLLAFQTEVGLVGAYDHPSIRGHEALFLQDDFGFELWSQTCPTSIRETGGNWALSEGTLLLQFDGQERTETYRINVDFNDSWVVSLRRVPTADDHLASAELVEELRQLVDLTTEEELMALRSWEKRFLKRRVRPIE